jgi:flagellar biosynthesis protein FlhA
MEYADDRLTLRVLTLDPKLEKKFVDSSGNPVDNGSGVTGNGYSAEAEQRSADLAAADCADLISSAVKGMEEKGFPPVILCSPRARFPVKEATRRKLPELAVLSYLEIPSDISVEPVGEIRFEKA